MRTLTSFLFISCLGVLSACTLFVEVKDPPANNGNNVNNTNNATCGDGVKNGAEEACDKEDLGGATCETLSYEGGTLACTNDCQFDVSACEGTDTCGNGLIELDEGEACDGTNLNGQTCVTLGFEGGPLTCTDGCTVDTSQCNPGDEICDDSIDNDQDGTTDCDDSDCSTSANCNGSETSCDNQLDDDADGFIDCDDSDCSTWPECMITSEDCDDNFDNDADGKVDCLDPDCAGFPGCAGSCGDDTVNHSTGEQCDGANLDGKTCFDLGYSGGGVLNCDYFCHFDFSGCLGTASCGNGVVESSNMEQCDGNDLAGETCLSMGFATGTLTCDPTTCMLDTNLCSYGSCSDGIISIGANEECDGTLLQGYGCTDFGFLSGALACDATSCHFDFAPCTYTYSLPIMDLVSSSGAHTCAASSSSVRCWGFNQSLQLGAFTAPPYRPTPGQAVKIGAANLGASAIATGSQHSCAVATNSGMVGQVVCWGKNATGQMGIGSMTPQEPPVLAGTLTNVTALAAGGDHTCALKANGTVWCWGNNWYGQAGVGATHNYILTPTQVSNLTDFVTDIAAGAQHTCAVRTQVAGQGELYCWGSNSAGQLGNNSTTLESSPVQISSLTNAQRVACGSEHTCAVAGGQIYCWGSNDKLQLGITGSNKLTPQQVPGLSAFKIMAGGDNTCIIQNTTGPVYCWGNNEYGQLAQGNNTVVTGPIVLTLNGFNGLSVGGGHTCGVWLDGTDKKVMCWGGNWNGQLGNGSNVDQYSPTEVLGQ